MVMRVRARSPSGGDESVWVRSRAHRPRCPRTADEGETTDEDLPPPQSIASTRSVLGRRSVQSDDSEYDATEVRRTRSRRLGPSLCSWATDPSKPIAVVDSTGKRIIIYPALRPPPTMTTTNNVADSAPDALYPFTDSALYPFIDADSDSGDSMGSSEGDGDDDDDDQEEDEGEMLLRLDDFIDFGDSDDDDDGEDLGEFAFSAVLDPRREVTGTMSSGTAADRSGVDSDLASPTLLDHLDRDEVTPFRRDHYRNTPFFSRPQLRDYTTFGSSSLTNGALKAGRMAFSHPPVSSGSRKRRLSVSSDSSWAGIGTTPPTPSHKRVKSY